MPTESEDPTPRRKARVFTEEIKQRRVSHWDWDYLSSEELERLQREAKARREGEAAE